MKTLTKSFLLLATLSTSCLLIGMNNQPSSKQVFNRSNEVNENEEAVNSEERNNNDSTGGGVIGGFQPSLPLTNQAADGCCGTIGG